MSANFYGAQITTADFSHANFNKGQFFEATISFSNFSYTNLKHAEFRGAKLTNISLFDANLYKAIFTGAHLTHSQLQTALTVQDATLPNGTLGVDLNIINNKQVKCHLSQLSAWIVQTGNVTRSLCSNSSRHCQFTLQTLTTGASMAQRISLAHYRSLRLWPRSQVVLRTNMSNDMTIEWKQIGSMGQILLEQKLGNLQH